MQERLHSNVELRRAAADLRADAVGRHRCRAHRLPLGQARSSATSERAEEAAAWNNGENVDPNSVGQVAYDTKKRKISASAATARNEGVRKNSSNKGISDGALES